MAATLTNSAKRPTTLTTILLVCLVVLLLAGQQAACKPQVFGGGYTPGLGGYFGMPGFGGGGGYGGNHLNFQQGYQDVTSYQHASNGYSNFNSGGGFGFGRRR